MKKRVKDKTNTYSNRFGFIGQNMANKRKLRDGTLYPVKHRYSLKSQSKCNQFELEKLWDPKCFQSIKDTL